MEAAMPAGSTVDRTRARPAFGCASPSASRALSRGDDDARARPWAEAGASAWPVSGARLKSGTDRAADDRVASRRERESAVVALLDAGFRRELDLCLREPSILLHAQRGATRSQQRVHAISAATGDDVGTRGLGGPPRVPAAVALQTDPRATGAIPFIVAGTLVVIAGLTFVIVRAATRRPIAVTLRGAA